jgi:hypothetical protein
MPPELHIRPGALRSHAAAAAALSEELCGAAIEVPGPAGDGDDPERLRVAVLRAVAELAELGAALDSAAADAESADRGAAGAFGRLGEARR